MVIGLEGGYNKQALGLGVEAVVRVLLGQELPYFLKFKDMRR
jgi:acetoin utilization deacetylase AcuC-like enzyme